MVSAKPWEIGHTRTPALTVSVSTFGHNLKNVMPILHVGLVLERDPSDFLFFFPLKLLRHSAC